MQKTFSNDLLSRLPQVRGRYTRHASLAKVTWFQVGGPADVLYKPADMDDLKFFLRQKPKEVPLNLLGVGSNLLVRNGGVPGVVIRLGRGFTNLAFSAGYVDVGAAVLDRTLAVTAANEGQAGFEYLCGIPGTLGGALRMNAGCYGAEIQDQLEVAFALDGQGQQHALTQSEMGFGYRHCAVPDDWIFVGARLKTRAGSAASLKDRMAQLLAEREKTQPVHTRTGGSTFANPVGHKAWQLIDQAGCRGWQEGDAYLSNLHCNFMINQGKATATDLEILGNRVQAQVFKTSGINLEWELKRWGTLAHNQQTQPAPVSINETSPLSKPQKGNAA